MKQNHTPLLFIAFLLLAMGNTAFIIAPKVVVHAAATTINSPVPPQYEGRKMTFFERTMLKKMSKKVNQQNDQIDLDKTAKYAQKQGILSLGAILATFLIILLAATSPSLLFLSFLSLLTFLAAPVLGIKAIITANRVLKNSEATNTQKGLAKQGKRLGFLTLIITLGIIVLTIIAMSDFSFNVNL